MQPTQPNVDRSSFQTELMQNRGSIADSSGRQISMIEQMAWMVNGEIGLDKPVWAQQVQLETAFNRAQYRGDSLGQALLPRRNPNHDDGGYYDGISPHPTYAERNRPSPEQVMRFYQAVLEPVLRGSNVSDVGYGPMTGNASGPLAIKQLRNLEGYKLNGADTYLREGPFRRSLPTIRPPAPRPPAPQEVTPGANQFVG
jgi:hypothetical protein